MKTIRSKTSSATKRPKKGWRPSSPAPKAGVWMAIPTLVVRHFGTQVGDEVRWTWNRHRQQCTLRFFRAGQPLEARGGGSASAAVMEWMWLGPEHSPAMLSRKCARELLRYLMGKISQQQYAAGWLMNLEYLLWDLLDHPEKRGLLPFERAGLKHLAQIAGGWWTYDDEPKFLEHAEWLAQYQNHVRSKTVDTRP
jgi:hypothetical protein